MIGAYKKSVGYINKACRQTGNCMHQQ